MALSCAGEPSASEARDASRTSSAPTSSAADEEPKEEEEEEEEETSNCTEGMASIPGGRFEMRTRKTTVNVKPFCLDVHEATVADYAECLRAGRCTQSRPNACNGPTIDFEGKDTHPIVCIDFEQAEAYCEFRHKRLPLDEEWEWAARGGRKGSEFPWGSAPPDHQLCWSGPGPSERRGTCPVGTFGASSWGVHDLAGNVAEWTTTRNDDNIPERSARGGSWRDRSRNAVRAARPGWFKPNYKSAFLGVRCAQDAS